MSHDIGVKHHRCTLEFLFFFVSFLFLFFLFSLNYSETSINAHPRDQCLPCIYGGHALIENDDYFQIRHLLMIYKIKHLLRKILIKTSLLH